jgi:multiple sugar transport system permease protein
MQRGLTSATHLTPGEKVKRFIGKTVLLWPAILLLLLFFLWPILMALYYSVTNMALSGAAARELKFIGLENYRKLFSDVNMFNSIKKTLVFLIGSIIGQDVLGFMMAYFMKRKNRIVRRIVGSAVRAARRRPPCRTRSRWTCRRGARRIPRQA